MTNLNTPGLLAKSFPGILFYRMYDDSGRPGLKARIFHSNKFDVKIFNEQTLQIKESLCKNKGFNQIKTN